MDSNMAKDARDVRYGDIKSVLSALRKMVQSVDQPEDVLHVLLHESELVPVVGFTIAYSRSFLCECTQKVAMQAVRLQGRLMVED